MDRNALFLALSTLFEPPSDATGAAIVEALDDLPDAQGALRTFLDDVSCRGRAEREELFSRTFDLAPQCVPYASVHLFGEESYKRAELMAGLAAAYAREDLPPGPELPDHLAELLRNASRLPEWPELVEAAVVPALGVMIDEAERAKNPYAHALRAVLAVVARDVSMTLEQALALAARHRPHVRRDDGRVSPGPVLSTNRFLAREGLHG